MRWHLCTTWRRRSRPPTPVPFRPRRQVIPSLGLPEARPIPTVLTPFSPPGFSAVPPGRIGSPVETPSAGNARATLAPNGVGNSLDDGEFKPTNTTRGL
jgi:hypothetical protein